MMTGSLSIPKIIPAMVLSEVVFFPHSLLPLYIFEPHNKALLRDIIGADRMFTIINSVPDDLVAPSSSCVDETVTLGMLRACHTYKDGTSTLLLQGICRLTVQAYVTNSPYPQLQVSPVKETMADPNTLKSLRNQTLRLLEKIHQNGGDITGEAISNLRQINTPQYFVDHAAASFLKSPSDTQTLLKCSDPVRRYSNLLAHLEHYCQRTELINSIMNNVILENIGLN